MIFKKKDKAIPKLSDEIIKLYDEMNGDKE